MTNSSEEFFYQNLQDKFNKAKREVKNFIYRLSDSSNPDEICASALKALEDLSSMLRESDWPVWLKNSLIMFNNIDSSKLTQTSNSVFEIATNIYPAMLSHEWIFSESSTSDFDFDKIYQKHRDEQKIPELFDQIAEWLEKIIQSGEIDSIKVSKQLNQIINTLRKSKNGSYLATFGAWNLVTRWLKNTGWELLGEIPIGGAVVRGLNITLRDADEAMKSMNEGIQIDFETNILTDFPKLEYHSPEIPRIETYEDTNGTDLIVET